MEHIVSAVAIAAICFIGYKYNRAEGELRYKAKRLNERVTALESFNSKKELNLLPDTISVEYLLGEIERRVSNLERCYQCPFYLIATYREESQCEDM